MNKKVVLGLSGGVDSAVAARLLQKEGYEVFGLFLDIGIEGASEDAKKNAEFLGIPLRVLDISTELEKHVCSKFADSYLHGETPNPCILCNPLVKFKALTDYADNISAEFISTGHYAIVKDGHLFKGQPSNDQSYMLSRLNSSQLSRLILPLGNFEKSHVRELALEMGIPVAKKPDSMEICFIPDKDYASFIEKRGFVPPEGNFVDSEGNILGRHRGIHHYTIGQRRGLRIALGKRVFVSEIRPETNEVVLSDDEVLYTDSISVRDMNWIVSKSDSFKCDVRVRHSRTQYPATATPSESSAEVVFEEPVRAPTKGQAAVFYDGDEVIGGGFIK